MKKTFSFSLTALAVLVTLLLCTSALAGETGCPVQLPGDITTMPTQWQLFAAQPVDYQLTLQVDEETGLRTYTIQNPADWGIDAAAFGVWQYQDATAGDQPEMTGEWTQTAAEGNIVQLLLTNDTYEQTGFPKWTVPCSGAADSLTLNAYLGQIRHLYAYVDYQFGEDTISVYAQDNSFTVSCIRTEDETVISTYVSYDPSGILAYASYSIACADGSLTTYRMEAIPQQQCYVLTEVYHCDAEGQLFYWVNGQWQNEGYEPVEAPAGVSTEELPFAITGDWAGIPFEEPGDKPEGSFPAGSMPSDPSLVAADYQPWPEDIGALYLRWVDAGLVPVLPAASWATQEDGTVTFTLTGLEKWGLAEAHAGDWHWNAFTGKWDRGEHSTPGTMTLMIPAGQPAQSIRWEQPTRNEGEQLCLALNRSGLLQEVCLTGADGSYWQMDNQGGLICRRTLDSTHWLLATYDQYALQDYSVHTTDEAGNLLTQAYYAPEDTGDPFELACFFLYSNETGYEECLWIRNVGWYSYETGEPCECPEGIDLAEYPPLVVE